MKPFSRFILVVALSATSAHADALSELAAFSSIKDIKIDALAGGTVKSGRGANMSYPKGMAIEAVYLVRKPLSRTAELHQKWTPTKHPELRVFLHQGLSAKPSGAEFQKLSAAPSNASVKAFAAATRKLPSDRGGLQMSNAEAKGFGGDSAEGTGMSPAVTTFWAGLLQKRAQAFVGGGLSQLAPYEVGGDSIKAAEEVARLLKEAPKVRGQFASLIDATPLAGGKGSLSPTLYWEMIDVEGQAAVTLGATYSKSSPKSFQSVDVQYYGSGGFYALLTFQQMWPVTVDGKEATLVWRGDLISAAALGTRRGVERMGSSTAMMRETQKSVTALLNDISKAP